jgi:putative transposase
MTVDAVTTRTSKEKACKPEADAQQRLAAEVIEQAREQGLALTGPDGLLGQLTKTVLETALEAEMTEHLGHAKYADQPGREGSNVRNGSRAKTVISDAVGEVEVTVPRDREGTFEPVMVKKRQRRLGSVDEIVLSLR